MVSQESSRVKGAGAAGQTDRGSQLLVPGLAEGTGRQLSLPESCQNGEQGLWSPLCRRGDGYLQFLLQATLLGKKNTLSLMVVTINTQDREVT